MTGAADVPTLKHPAKFSAPILQAIDDILTALVDKSHGDVVVDPFAGTGRIHLLRPRWKTFGVDIEPEWGDCHEHNTTGNSRHLSEVLHARWGIHAAAAVATSPTYGNRMADRLLREGRKDYTYGGHHSGLGRALDEDNSGGMQWGAAYRELHEAVWAECARVAPVLVLNVKDHSRGGVARGVPLWHATTLGRWYDLIVITEVATRGSQNGANKTRGPHREWVLGFKSINQPKDRT